MKEYQPEKRINYQRKNNYNYPIKKELITYKKNICIVGIKNQILLQVI